MFLKVLAVLSRACTNFEQGLFLLSLQPAKEFIAFAQFPILHRAGFALLSVVIVCLPHSLAYIGVCIHQ
jgi:hypothetical protein